MHAHLQNGSLHSMSSSLSICLLASCLSALWCFHRPQDESSIILLCFHLEVLLISVLVCTFEGLWASVDRCRISVGRISTLLWLSMRDMVQYSMHVHMVHLFLHSAVEPTLDQQSWTITVLLLYQVSRVLSYALHKYAIGAAFKFVTVPYTSTLLQAVNLFVQDPVYE